MENKYLVNDKMRLIKHLTGVNSSKLNYYLEVKKINEEIVKQNNRLEIIHQIIKDINIDMSLADIIERVYRRLPLVIHCDFLGLALMRGNELVMAAMVPECGCTGHPIPFRSLLRHAVRDKKSKVYSLGREDSAIYQCPPVRELSILSLSLDPLFVKGNVIGALMIGSARENAYSEDEIKFIRQLADQLAICIENARLYEQVLSSKIEWEETFRALTDPILLIDRNMDIIRCNERMDALPGQSAGESEKSKCYRYVWGRDSKCDNCMLDIVNKNRAPAYRRMQLESGKTFDVYYYPVFNARKEVYSVIHHIKDVTEKIRMEVQLMQSAKLAAIGEMAAGVAHELNSPMTVIIGNSQMILRDQETGCISTDLMKDVVNCGLRCKKIIQNLLTFSRQDQQPMAPVSLNNVVNRVLSLIKYQITRSGIIIELDLAAHLPEVAANEHQLDQVLINLILNARDALEKNSQDKRIIISTGVKEFEQAEFVSAMVTDNGEGIPGENLMKIFNPFFTSKGAAKGTGLGLSVSLGIAEAHDGTIEVVSKPGRGSSFSLLIPVKSCG